MLPDAHVVGWDLGGAHLKLAALNADGRIQQVEQFATPLWQGLEQLEDIVADLARDLPLHRCDHFMTMTGELADLFDDRAQGVAQLVDLMAGALPTGRLHLYAGPNGFVRPAQALEFQAHIASANWYATASLVAGSLPRGLLVDVGTTTSDVLFFSDGAVLNRGYSDRERLGCEELVYSGVVRTPVMAMVRQVPFRGQWLQLANEHFATLADVYRILGWLPAKADLLPSTDGREKSELASMRRLARMIGADLNDADPPGWRSLAAYVADRQLDVLALACARQFSRAPAHELPLVGAGIGRFLVRRLAQRQERAYIDINDVLGGPLPTGEDPAVCAPAVAVARLGMEKAVACAS